MDCLQRWFSQLVCALAGKTVKETKERLAKGKKDCKMKSRECIKDTGTVEK